SVDNKAKVFIKIGTIVMNKIGQILPSIIVEKFAETTHPYTNREIIGSVYDIGPDGAQFDPPASLTLRYDEESIPEGISEEDLYIATWNEESQEWERMESTLNSEDDSIDTLLAHFSTYTIMADRLADFALSELTIIPAEVSIGEDVTINVLVTNTSNITGNYEAILKIDDIVKETKEITLAGSDNTTVSFLVTGENIGTYSVDVGGLEDTLTVLSTALPTPASFEISSLKISPDEVAAGEDVDISITVTNTGGSSGNYEVILKINGIVVDTKDVQLNAGASEEVAFTTALDTAGKRIIDVNGLVGGLVVQGEISPPAQIPLPLEKPEPEPAPEMGEIPSVPTQPAPTEPSSVPESNWWLVVVISAGCVTLAALLLYFTWWRKRGKPK
ncbi:CARDB domain-containing protein, partial [Chloroflexota bacterium]